VNADSTGLQRGRSLPAIDCGLFAYKSSLNSLAALGQNRGVTRILFAECFVGTANQGKPMQIWVFYVKLSPLEYVLIQVSFGLKSEGSVDF